MRKIRSKILGVLLSAAMILSGVSMVPAPVFAASSGIAMLSNPAVSTTGVTETISFTTTADISANTYFGIVDGGTNIGSATAAQISTTGIPGGLINETSSTATASAGGLGASPPNALVAQNSGDIPSGTNVVIVVTGLTNVSTANTYSVYVGTSNTYTTGQPTWDLSASGTSVGWNGVTETISPTTGQITVTVEPSMQTQIVFPSENPQLAAGQVADEPLQVSVLTNASSYVVNLSATTLSGTTNGKTIPDVPGTVATPVAFPSGTAAWGYAITSASDSSVIPSTMPTDGSKWAALNHTGTDVIMSGTGPTGSTAKSETLDLRFAPGWTSQAGQYQTIVSVAVVPTYSN